MSKMIDRTLACSVLLLGVACGASCGTDEAPATQEEALLTPGMAAEDRPPKGTGIESDDYVWNERAFETVEALKLAGDVDRGKRVYEPCEHCHLPMGQGQEDGAFPQIAGQHSTVLVKQLIDIRDGRRDNPVMYPYAAKLTDPQELADLALYISLLAYPEMRTYGPGTDLETGARIFARNCAGCHGARGQGNAKAFYPIIGGQNYDYLLRQLRNVAAGQRRNAHPAMAVTVAKLEDAGLVALADYVSRLPWPRAGSSATSPDE